MFVLHRPTPKQSAVVGIVALLLILPLLLQNSSYSYLIRIFGLVGLYMMIALGLNIVLGFLGLLDLGFMAFYALGAYSMAILSSHGFGFWTALVIGIVFTMAIRALLGMPVLRLRGDYLAIVTLGFGEITRIVLNNWDSLTNGPKGISLLTNTNLKPISLLGWRVDTTIDFYYVIALFVALGVLISARLLNSRVGRAWMAIREDEVAARLTGIEIAKMKMIGFVASAGFAAAAGGIFARWENFVTPESFTFWESVMLVTMVVIGGMGSIPGTLLGVAIVVLVPEVLRNFLSAGFESWRYLFFGIALVAVAVFRPQGLWPSERRARELVSDDSLRKTAE